MSDMEDLLSEDELDALLGDESTAEPPASADGSPALERGGTEPPAARNAPSRTAAFATEPFDLTRPAPLDPASLRVLERLLLEFASTLSDAWSAELRARVRLALRAVEQVRFDAVLETLPEPLLVHVLREPARGHRWLCSLEPRAAFALLDRLLGGPGGESTPQRAPTALERRLLAPLTDALPQAFAQAFSRATAIEPRLERTETSVWLARVCSDHEPVLAAVFELEGELAGGRLHVTLPVPLCHRLHTPDAVETGDTGVAQADTAGAQAAPVRRALGAVQLELAAMLGSGRITVRELLSLGRGDVVVLSKRVGDPLVLRVGGRPRFTGTVGTVGGRYGFRIAERLPLEETRREAS